MTTEPRIDSFIQLSDKRKLAFAEYGDPSGTPFFLFHGLPGSRLSWGMMPGQPFPPNVRIVAPDRPGYGRSDPKPSRTLLDWADDVAELADALKIDKFSVIGVSGGGPGALACAWMLPERLNSVGVVASAAPTDAPGAFEGMSKINRFFMKLAWRMPWLSALNIRFLAFMIRRNPARYLNRMKFKLRDADKEVLTRPEIQQMLTQDFAEALRGGAEGMIADMAANHGRPWGFPLEEVKTKVHLWYGELDIGVPPAMGRYLSETIPDCELKPISGAGHLWMMDHMNEVIATLQTHARQSVESRKSTYVAVNEATSP